MWREFWANKTKVKAPEEGERVEMKGNHFY